MHGSSGTPAGPGAGRAAPVRGRVRLTRRGRVVLLGAALLLSLLVTGLVATAAPAASTGGDERGGSGSASVAVVRPGDTLWSVAARHRPSHDASGMIEEIRRLNGLAGTVVHPGQQLRMPPG